MVLPAFGQAVISTHAGVVHFFEGPVSVAGQPLQAQFGRFSSVPEGAGLRTEQGGRAEVLLTPGVFLRVGEKSAIRMNATGLADTRVELLSGSAMVESGEPVAGTSVTVTFQKWNVQQAHQGLYRVDSNPPHLEVRDGDVKVWATGGDAPVIVGQGMNLPFEAVLAPEKSTGETHDALSDWVDGRNQSIGADNAIAANIQDPANMSNSYGLADAFTYFPMLGYPALSVSPVGAYGSVGSVYGAYATTSPLYQPGFYSLYLPGYTYRPLYLHMPVGLGGGLGTGLGLGHTTLYPTHTLYPPSRIGGPGTTLPRPPVVLHPMTPAPVAHPPAVHVGGHK